jgi:hypothetical protein
MTGGSTADLLESTTYPGTTDDIVRPVLEITYRRVNIVLVNEIAMSSHDLGVDVWNAIQCARASEALAGTGRDLAALRHPGKGRQARNNRALTTPCPMGEPHD